MNLYFNGPDSAFFSNAALTAKNLVPFVPSYATELANTSRILSVQYGDGYKQRMPDGPNSLLGNFNVVFQNRDRALIEELVHFFRGDGFYVSIPGKSGRTPNQWFWWQPPQPYDYLGFIQITCDAWPVSWVSSNVGTLRATFNQVFSAPDPT